MNPNTLLKVKFVIYTITALGVAWNTSMSGVKWDSMGWEEHSCLLIGILVLWLQTLAALVDKTAAEARQYNLDNSNKQTKVIP